MTTVVIDHGRISPGLGGLEGLRSLVAVLRRHGMGLLLDIVPNHMGVGGADNALWLDVLEWGPARTMGREVTPTVAGRTPATGKD